MSRNALIRMSLVALSSLSLSLLPGPARAQDAAPPAGSPAPAATAAPAADAAPVGNAAEGEKVFVVCRACHQIGPGAKNGIAPVLNGVVGRKAGTYPGYDYSTANKTSGITWTVPELQKYIANPQKVVPGTKMIFPGIKDPAKVNDVIAFLSQYNEDGTKKQ